MSDTETCTFCGVTPSETITAAGDNPGVFYDIPVCQTHWVDYQNGVDKQEPLYD